MFDVIKIVEHFGISVSKKIKTYSTETFRDQYMVSGRHLDGMLKSDFGKFFVVRVQDLIRLIKLPVPPIRSTTHTLIYLTSGEATMTIGSERFTIRKDACLVVPAGQLYSFSKLDVNKGFLCNFHHNMFLGQDITKVFDFLQVWGNPHVKLSSDSSEHVQHLFKRILSQYEIAGLENKALLQSYFMAMLQEIKLCYKGRFEKEKVPSVKLTNRFKELLFQTIRSEHRVSAYASLLHVTPGHLNKVVRSVTGKSPAKWISETLILEAKVLLYQTELPVSEVSASIGLDDQSYFSRLFKKHEGVTPLEFRKMIEKS